MYGCHLTEVARAGTDVIPVDRLPHQGPTCQEQGHRGHIKLCFLAQHTRRTCIARMATEPGFQATGQ